MFYTNKTSPLITHSSIIEWDIRSGNTSMMREYQLAPENLISKIEKMNKNERVKTVGIMMKKKDFSKALEESFNDAMKRFIKVNQIEEDEIVSIKRDAIYLRAKEPKLTQLGDHITFRPKGSYVAFLLMNGYEFYLKSTGTFDIKGISDELIPLHENGLLDFIKTFLQDFDYDTIGLNQYCKEFVSVYKRKELPFDYYREFDNTSAFRLVEGTSEYRVSEIGESDVDALQIDYNYKNFILPLIQYLF